MLSKLAANACVTAGTVTRRAEMMVPTRGGSGVVGLMWEGIFLAGKFLLNSKPTSSGVSITFKTSCSAFK